MKLRKLTVVLWVREPYEEDPVISLHHVTSTSIHDAGEQAWKQWIRKNVGEKEPGALKHEWKTLFVLMGHLEDICE